MHVYVTGARGFVGSRLVPALEAAGHSVTGADREVDVTDEAALRTSIGQAQAEAVIHLAAQSSVGTSLSLPDETWRVNHGGTRALLAAVIGVVPDARVLVIGSADQYSPSEPGSSPLTESTPLQPRSPYAKSKAAAEELALEAHRDRGLDVVCVRAFNHTGPGQTTRFVVPDFAQQIARMAWAGAEPRMRVGNLDSVRDFLDVRDVVRAYVMLIERDVPANVYNVASGRGTRVGDLLERLCGFAGVRPTIETDPARHRPTDWLVGDASRLARVTGWKPEHDFDETLREVLDYERAQLSQPSKATDT